LLCMVHLAKLLILLRILQDLPARSVIVSTSYYFFIDSTLFDLNKDPLKQAIFVSFLSNIISCNLDLELDQHVLSAVSDRGERFAQLISCIVVYPTLRPTES
jgi:hypothetical protein